MTSPHAGADQQISLAGFSAQRPGDRVFFAVHPDAQAAQRIVALAHSVRAAHGLRGNPLREDRVHVTLHHLGDHAGLPESLIATATEAAARMAAQPFEVSFDWVASIPGRARKRPCVLRSGDGNSNAALFALQHALGEELRVSGLARYVERRFTPHVTLLYDERPVAPQAVPPIGWTVRELVLVHSLIGRSEHRVLGRWGLSA
ncbi:MAG TPA: 2'-5' RNA ligase family protein [Rhodanobacteraceae bacterium]|nr:2'-5' RNA ligase family protein [Rhodanobacteraceae bacterium]